MSNARFKFYGATVPGPQHTAQGLPNQDSIFYAVKEDLAFGMVADGAGSLEFSDQGSLKAVAAAAGLISSQERDTLEELAAAALEEAEFVLKQLPDYKAYGTTLSLVLMNEAGEWATGSVGDSFSVVHLTSGEHVLTTGESAGSYANVTRLLTSDTVGAVTKSGTGACGFSLASDGLELITLKDGEAYPGFWNGLLAKAKDGSLDVLRLFAWLEEAEKIVDDTSLVTAVLED